MSDLTDEQQVEQLKAWWQENGKTLLAVIGLGIVGSVGWLKWQDSQLDARQDASAVFQRANDAADRNDAITLDLRIKDLKEQYGDSPYVTLAELRKAALLLADGDAAEARTTLEALKQRERGSELEPLIASRLARIALYLDDPDGALAALNGVDSGKFEPFFQEIRGDAYVALGEAGAARDAYQAALDDPGQPQLIDVSYVGIKLAQLASDEETVATP
ncbi:MAG: tetratricopeptide repeat protein [Pseudomonadota bacterium]